MSENDIPGMAVCPVRRNPHQWVAKKGGNDEVMGCESLGP